MQIVRSIGLLFARREVLLKDRVADALGTRWNFKLYRQLPQI